MSESIAAAEREFSMSKLLIAAKQEIVFLLRSIRLRFKKRITIFHKRLQTEGTIGDDIRLFQERFNQFACRYGIRIPVSGVYDSYTVSGVQNYQRDALLVHGGDGFVGPVTARSLHIKLLGE